VIALAIATAVHHAIHSLKGHGSVTRYKGSYYDGAAWTISKI